MKVSERLEELLNEKGYTKAHLARCLEMHYNTYNNYHLGINDVNSDVLIKLAKFYNVSTDYLLGLVDSKHARYSAPDDIEQLKAIGGFHPAYKKKVPILGRIAAGIPIFADEYIEGYQNVENEKIDYCLIIRGDSMTPVISDGSLVYVQKDAEIKNGDIVVALINGDDATVKYYYRYTDDIVLRSENKAYDEQHYKLNEIDILGKVIGNYESFD